MESLNYGLDSNWWEMRELQTLFVKQSIVERTSQLLKHATCVKLFTKEKKWERFGEECGIYIKMSQLWKQGRKI